MKRILGVLCAVLFCVEPLAHFSARTPPGHDPFYHMTLMNKASDVMLAVPGKPWRRRKGHAALQVLARSGSHALPLKPGCATDDLPYTARQKENVRTIFTEALRSRVERPAAVNSVCSFSSQLCV
jgi:hypothetical protein